MPDLMELPTKIRPRFFTKENARQFQAKSAAARKQASLARLAEPTPKPTAPVAKPTAEPIADSCVNEFTKRKLARIRGQIDRVEGLLDAACEPQAVDRFANALTRLYDLERVLAGRPLPGSKRPAPERATKAREAGAWLALTDPAPLAQAETPAPARPLGWEYDVPTAAPAPGQVMPGPAPDPTPPTV